MLTRIDFNAKISKKKFNKKLPALEEQIYCLQKASWDADAPIIILVEGWETVRKSRLIRSLTAPLDPRGFVFHAIRSALPHEKARPWLWRFWLKTPERGQWAIFDQSWYRRIFYEHPHENISEQDLRRALRDINDFERTLSDGGTIILKFFLHTEKNTYKTKANLSEKSAEPLTGSEAKLLSRRYDSLFGIYADGLKQTHQDYAPWHIIPANNGRTTRYQFLKTIVKSLQQHLGVECKPKQTVTETGTPSPGRKTTKPKRTQPLKQIPEVSEPLADDGSDTEKIEQVSMEDTSAQTEPDRNQPSPSEVELDHPDRLTGEPSDEASTPLEGEAS